jgi:hypothetical protein
VPILAALLISVSAVTSLVAIISIYQLREIEMMKGPPRRANAPAPSDVSSCRRCYIPVPWRRACDQPAAGLCRCVYHS